MLWYDRGMSNDVAPNDVVLGTIRRRYVPVAPSEIQDPDLLNAKNNLSAAQMREILQNSPIMDIALTQVLTGKRCFIDQDLMNDGLKPEESVIISDEEINNKDRNDLLKMLLNKAYPNAKEIETTTDEDNQSRYIKMVEELDEAKNVIEADFDNDYQEEEAPSEDDTH